MPANPADKATRHLLYLKRLETQERLKTARYLEQQETFRAARRIVFRGLRKLVGLRPR